MDSKRINIVIASPSDVQAERNSVLLVFNRWNGRNEHAFLHPEMWEHAAIPTLGDYPQALLNRQIIDKSDLLVAILWSKLGTPTATARSGTVEEIREFVKHKGPRRVMIYFCTRDLPHNIDPGELVKLREFKSEIAAQGIYHEYKSVEQFEADLYQHMDGKVQEFLTNKLPLPSIKPQSNVAEQVRRPDQKNEFPDPRLREQIEFGTNLKEISALLEHRMKEFRSIDGAGGDKYLDLGAHVYNSAATCLDRFLTYSAEKLDQVARSPIHECSARLKRLAASSSDYTKKPFSDFFTRGDEISRDLAAHVAFLSRTDRLR